MTPLNEPETLEVYSTIKDLLELWTEVQKWKDDPTEHGNVANLIAIMKLHIEGLNQNLVKALSKLQRAEEIAK